MSPTNFAEKGADLERVDAWIGLWNQIFEEDREAAEIQQKGLRTSRLPWMRYGGAREEPVLFFRLYPGLATSRVAFPPV